MADHYSRRSFLSGVLACGTLSASVIYLLPGGRSLPAVELRLVTGTDRTGARDLLIDMWNRTHPQTLVRQIDPIGSGSGDERTAMLNRAVDGEADILNLDVIDIPEFAQKELITPISLPGAVFVEPAGRVSRLDDGSERYWALPVNTDAGLLFKRRTSDRDTTIRGLAEALDEDVVDGSRNFVGQLTPNTSANDESFVVNVLEHALSRDPEILDDAGVVSDDLDRWRAALAPLRDAIGRGRVELEGADSEDETMSTFAKSRLRYMRNWPVQYRRLQQEGDDDLRAGRIQVDPLPVGILGGQSLALAATSPHADRALEFIRFMTDEPAQKILAAHGLAPTRIGAYGDANLRASVPHLSKVRQAVEQARPRPRNVNYREFAKVVRRHVNGLLYEKRELSTEFVVQMGQALG